MENHIRVGFLGAGRFAHAHAFALDNLKYFYSDVPSFDKVFVASPTPSSREQFANRYGFKVAIPPENVWDKKDIDTLFILGPNDTHTPQLLKAVEQPHIKRIYVEKPIGTSQQEILNLEKLDKSDHGKLIMLGFQHIQKSALRKALQQWKTGVFGEPISFRSEYLHSNYFDPTYRLQNQARLQPIPINGAAADLGSHVLSLLMAFLGEDMVVRAAAASGRFADVHPNSDLCCTALIEETHSGAIGTMVASRVSHGTGDHLSLEIRGTAGALLFDTSQPDCYQSFLPNLGWQQHNVMSNYLPASKFPADYAPSGWLRALVHNLYLFLDGNAHQEFLPNLHHGIQVQRLLLQIADHVLAS